LMILIVGGTYLAVAYVSRPIRRLRAEKKIVIAWLEGDRKVGVLTARIVRDADARAASLDLMLTERDGRAQLLREILAARDDPEVARGLEVMAVPLLRRPEPDVDVLLLTIRECPIPDVARADLDALKGHASPAVAAAAGERLAR